MKLLIGLIFFVGLIISYLLAVAFRLDMLTGEMLVHVALRFFTGFVILGIGVFYEHLFRLKHSLWFILVLFLADDCYDYYRNIDSFTPEVLIVSLFMLLWGALLGYVTMRAFKVRRMN